METNSLLQPIAHTLYTNPSRTEFNFPFAPRKCRKCYTYTQRVSHEIETLNQDKKNVIITHE